MPRSKRRESVHQPDGAVEPQASLPDALLPVLTATRASADRLADPIYLLDSTGIVRYANKALLKFNLDPKEVVGRHFLEFIQPDERDEMSLAFQRETHGAAEVLEFHLLDGSQTPRFVRAYSQPIVRERRFVGIEGVLLTADSSCEFGAMLERRAAQLAILNQIGAAFSSALEVEDVLKTSVEILHNRFGFFHVAVFLPADEPGMLHMAARAGHFAGLFPPKHLLKDDQGLVGWVFQNRQTALVGDVRRDPRYINFFPDRIPTSSELAVPVLAGENVLGVLDIQSPSPNAFDQNDSMVIETVAGQLALALQNARLYQQVRRRLEDQEHAEALMRLQRDLLSRLSSVQDYPEAIEVILSALACIPGIDCGSIYLVDEHGGLDQVAHSGLTPAFAAVVSYLPPQAHKSQFVREGRAGYLRYSELNLDPRIPADVRSREAILCLAVLPIHFQSRVFANLTLGSHTLPDFPAEARGVLEAVAAHLGAVLARIKAEKALRASEAYASALLAAIPDTFVVVDCSGRLVSFKPGENPLFNRPMKDLVGRFIGELLPADVADLALQAIRKAVAGHKTVGFTYTLPCGQGGAAAAFDARVSAINDELAIAVIRELAGPENAGGKSR